MTTTPEEPGDQEETGLPTAPDEVDESDDGLDDDEATPAAPVNTTNG